MPVPRSCRNTECPNHTDPSPGWSVHFGFYHTTAHGTVRRYRCRHCGATTSDQSESIHYFAKRRLPLKAMVASLNTGSSLRDVGRRYGVSCTAVRNGVLRLGRQAMAGHMIMLSAMNPRTHLAFDGLRSFVTSQDYPCDITTVVDRQSETIFTMTHSIFKRGGVMTDFQRDRITLKYAVWQPKRKSMKRDIRLLVGELWDYLRPRSETIAILDTDRHPLYRAALASNFVWRHFITCSTGTKKLLVRHRRTSSLAPRTRTNPLFPVNYVDRLLRHRVKEHTRETIAFGRHATVQMHRAWIFAWEHNMIREYRVKSPELGQHAEQGVTTRDVLRDITREFYQRRLRLDDVTVPTSIRTVWESKLATPPVRWQAGQTGTMVITPRFALADLAAGRRVP
jgi:hypothetical protein